MIGVATIVSLAVNRRSIGAALAKASIRLFSPIGFFGLVIVVFIVISVLILTTKTRKVLAIDENGNERMAAVNPQITRFACGNFL